MIKSSLFLSVAPCHATRQTQKTSEIASDSVAPCKLEPTFLSPLMSRSATCVLHTVTPRIRPSSPSSPLLWLPRPVSPRAQWLPSASTTCVRFNSPHRRHSSSRSSASSNIWLQRQRQDPFVRARSGRRVAAGARAGVEEAKTINDHDQLEPVSDPRTTSPESFVARSAFKLLELHQRSRNTLLRPGTRIVDLGAAPGGWLQAAAFQLAQDNHPQQQRRRRRPSRGQKPGPDGDEGPDDSRPFIVGVDLLPLNPQVLTLPGVAFVQGDFLDPRIQTRVTELLQGHKVDLVLSDMLANLTGNPLRDAQLSIDLCQSALTFALTHLNNQRPELKVNEPVQDKVTTKATRPWVPQLVMKCLQSSLSPELDTELKQHFRSVKIEKPSSSRPESREFYWVCSGLTKRKETSSRIESSKETDVISPDDLDSPFF